MGRTSSKTKKKSSKIHSEGRKKKRIRKSKSKKLHSRKDYSSSSGDDTRSLVSISSSSDDEHFRSRSRRRSELKGSKKRARDKSSTKNDKVSKIKKPHKKKLRREPSLSCDSTSSSANSVPSDTKKKLRKKRRKREPSFDSITSHSSSDEYREVESRRGRIREKSKGGRDLGETRSVRARSRSYSPYDRYEDGIDSSMPIVPAENNSRRLRSVITVFRPTEDEERELKRDEASVSELKSSEITSGNENKREEVSPVLPNPENDLESILRLKALENMIKYKGAQIEKLISPKVHNSNVEEQGQIEKLKAPTKFHISNIKEQAQTEKLKPATELCSSDGEEQSGVPVMMKSEPITILKKTQRANLEVDEIVVNENLEKISEHVSTASKNGGDLKSSVSEMGITPKKTQNASSLLADRNVDTKAAIISEKVGHSRKNVERNNVLNSCISERINNILKESRDTTSSVGESTVNNKAAISGSSGQASKKDEKDDNVPKSSISEPSSSRKPASEENSSKEHQSTSKKDEQDINVPKSSISDPSSSLKPPLEESISKEHQSTDKDGSQFEQKTMSVMRGGEMVQVSYKVYIPKKAPALARRSLRR